MKINIQTIYSGVSIFALVIFMSSGFGAKLVHAQTASGTNQKGQTEFKKDVEEGVREVKNDKNAQSNQQEIENDDSERADDGCDDVKEVDGENNQGEIDNEIDQEVDQEDGACGHSSDQESERDSSSNSKGN